jgi:alpha-L-rhamnosidase
MTNLNQSLRVRYGTKFQRMDRTARQWATRGQVRIRHAELLYENGTLNTENLRNALATDFYILKGKGKKSISLISLTTDSVMSS